MNRDARAMVVGIMAALLKGADQITAGIIGAETHRPISTMNNFQAAEKADALFDEVIKRVDGRSS